MTLTTGADISSFRYADKHALKNLYFVSHAKKFMFISISKNACTALKALLYRLEYGKDFPDPGPYGGVHHFFGYKERKGNVEVIDRRNRKALEPYLDYVRFVVYRDPVARFLSCYHNKVLWPGQPQPHFTRFRLEGMALDPFLDVVEETLRIPDPLLIDEHIRPQARYFTREDVNYVVDIKALPAFLEEQCGVTGLPRRNEHVGVKLVPTDRQADRIRALYQEDYVIVPNYTLPVAVK